VKSNWAQRLDTPPFYAYPVTCGITFTFGGVKITEKAEVLDTEGHIIRGLYAAGEITGGSFYHNYPGGAGLMKGAVFGRIAGLSSVAGGNR
jgi:tricarballylate dehydrogenase